MSGISDFANAGALSTGTVSPWAPANQALTVIAPDALLLSSASVTSAATIQIGGVPYIDTSGYSSISISFTSVGSGNSVTFEVSNDATNWTTKTLVYAGSVFAATATQLSFGAGNSISTLATYEGPLISRYLRVRVSTYGSGTVTAQGILRSTPYVPKPWAAMGPAAPGFAISASSPPVIAGLHARTANTAVADGQAINATGTLAGALVSKLYSIPEGDWSYAPPTGGLLNTTTAVPIASAPGAGLKNYVTAIQLSSEALGTATEFAIRDGAGGTVIWRTKIGTAGLINGRDLAFPSPLKGSANNLLEIVTLTASGTGAVYCNAQGYIAP